MITKHPKTMWEKIPSHLFRSLPLISILFLGPLMAWLIVTENFLYAATLPLALPVAIFLNRYPFATFFVWMIGMSMVPPSQHARYWYWIVHRLLIPLAISSNILSRMFKVKEQPPVRLSWPDMTMIIYVFLAIISVMVSDQLIAETRRVLFALYDRMFIAFTIYWLVRLLKPTDKDIARLIPFMIILCLAQLIVGFWGWFFPHSVPEIFITRRVLLGTRTTGTFGEPGPFSSALIFSMTFIFQYAMTRQQGGSRMISMIIVGLGFVGIFFSFSRGSWLAGFIVLAIWGILYSRTIIPLVASGSLIMIILLTTVFRGELIFAIERLNSDQTAESRIVLANAGWQMFLEKPIFGWGYASYDLHDWKYMERVGDVAPTRYEVQTGTSHNSYLTVLAEMGLVGFLCLAIPVFWWLLLTMRVWRRLPRDPAPGQIFDWRFLVMLWANVGFVVMVGQFIDMRFFWFTLGTLWFSLGLIGNYVDQHLRPDEMILPEWLKQRLLPA